jgi:hypothetical protein
MWLSICQFEATLGPDIGLSRKFSIEDPVKIKDKIVLIVP